VRDAVVQGAATRFGYSLEQIELRLYVGNFAGAKTGEHERRVREWCGNQHVGCSPIKVVGVKDVVAQVSAVAATTQYRNNAALVAMKVLEAAGTLSLNLPEPEPGVTDVP
jgi:hypothetical protein